MDFTLEVYFLGSALMQLAEDRDGKAAMLPAGYRAWAALPDLAEVAVFAEPEWLRHCDRAAIRVDSAGAAPQRRSHAVRVAALPTMFW